MKRRSFLTALGSAALFSQSAKSQYAVSRHGECFASDPMRIYRLCVSDTFSYIPAFSRPQLQSQWCWAACISTVFGFLGFPVDQVRVFRSVFGGNLPEWPAASGRRVTALLDRSWTADNGDTFYASPHELFNIEPALVEPPANGFRPGSAPVFKPGLAASDIAYGRPLILATVSHAMVLTRVDIFANGAYRLWVWDSWPGRGHRILSASEMTPMNELGGRLRYLSSVGLYHKVTTPNGSRPGRLLVNHQMKPYYNAPQSFSPYD